jgi:hypothetical protein
MAHGRWLRSWGGLGECVDSDDMEGDTAEVSRIS